MRTILKILLLLLVPVNYAVADKSEVKCPGAYLPNNFGEFHAGGYSGQTPGWTRSPATSYTLQCDAEIYQGKMRCLYRLAKHGAAIWILSKPVPENQTCKVVGNTSKFECFDKYKQMDKSVVPPTLRDRLR